MVAALLGTMLVAFAAAPLPPPAAPADADVEATTTAPISVDQHDCESDLDFFAIPDDMPSATPTRPRLTEADRAARRHVHGVVVQKQTITAEDKDRLEAILEVAREINPVLALRLRELKEREPESLVRALQTSGRKLRGMAELKQRDPEAYKFKLAEIRIERFVKDAANRLALAVRNDSAEEPALRQELRKHLLVQELVSASARRVYIERLRKHIKHLEDGLNRDATQIQSTVDKRMRELLDEMDIPTGLETGRPALAVDRTE